MNENFTWIYGIWFVPSADETKDFMGMLGIEDGKWTFNYRFRYYHPDSADPHDGMDYRRVYKATMKDASGASKAKALASQKAMIPVIEAEFGEKHDFILLDCKNDDPKVFEELSKRPWAHVRIEEPT